MRTIIGSRYKSGISNIFMVQGQCMEPLIFDSYSISVVPIVTHCKIGDIVVLELNGKLAAHRIISIFDKNASRERLVLTKGDNSLKPDGWRRELTIIGKVDIIYAPLWRINLNDPIWRYIVNYVSAVFSIISFISLFGLRHYRSNFIRRVGSTDKSVNKRIRCRYKIRERCRYKIRDMIRFIHYVLVSFIIIVSRKSTQAVSN